MRKLLAICILVISVKGYGQTDLPSSGIFIKPQLKLARVSGKYKLQIDSVQSNHWTNIATEKYVRDYVLNNSGATTKAFATVAALKASTFYLTTGSLKADILDGGASYSWDGSSTATDDGGVTSIQVTGVTTGRWIKIFKGIVRASEAGIKNDGTDQTASLNILFSLPTVKKVLFDNGNVKVDGTIYVLGKDLAIDNDAMLTGGGTIKNPNIIADARKQIFDTTLTIQDPRNTYFSIMWTGCKMDSYSSLATNNYTPFMKALGAVNTSGNTVWQRCILYVPGATDTTYYGYHFGFARTIKISTQVIIIGDNNKTSVLVFPGDSVGITMQIGSSKSILKDIGIWGRYAYSDPSNGYNNPNSAGILVQSNGGLYQNLWINGFDGDGIQNVGDVNQSTNSNNNHYLRDYITYNGRYGMFFAGGDANQCTTDHCDIVGNARNSIYENSFLGNLFIGVHSASNGSIHPKSRSTVRISGVSYWCTAPNKNVQPGVTSGWQDKWEITSGFYDPLQPQYQWNSTDSFFVGGSYLSEGANQRGSFYECYAEDDEMKVFPHQASTGTVTLFGFAEGYNKMTRGGNNGFKADGWQAIDTTEKIEVNHYGNGTRSLGFYDEDNAQTIAFSYYKLRKVMTVMTVNDNGASGGTWFASEQFPSSLLGLSATPRGSSLFNGKAFWKKEDGFYNSISIHNAVPSSGEYSAGDFIVNGGVDSTILGWMVRTSGSFSGVSPSISAIRNPNLLSASATLDFGSTLPSTSTDLTISVTGASDGDVILLGVPNSAVFANSCYTAWVSAANTVTVRFNNYDTSNTRNPSSATFKISIYK